jgi:hypothetical protein
MMVALKRLPARTKTLVIGSTLFLCAILYCLLVEGAPFSRLGSEATATQAYCSVDDIVHGRWMDSDPITSLDQIQQKYFHGVRFTGTETIVFNHSSAHPGISLWNSTIYEYDAMSIPIPSLPVRLKKRRQPSVR